MRMIAVLCLVLAVAPARAEPGQIWSGWRVATVSDSPKISWRQRLILKGIQQTQGDAK